MDVVYTRAFYAGQLLPGGCVLVRFVKRKVQPGGRPVFPTTGRGNKYSEDRLGGT